jgi:hypothetical protein
MSARDHGGPAFPFDIERGWCRGMNLRDYFAAKAMVGLVQYWGNSSSPELAKRAYELADALLQARKDGET